MPVDRPLFEPGDIVKHFKRETVSDLRSNDYLYKIVGEAKHTETDEPLIIYRALYGERKLYARPQKMFTVWLIKKNIQIFHRSTDLKNMKDRYSLNKTA